jgi:ABC-type Na+ efflux pump permease subunit
LHCIIVHAWTPAIGYSSSCNSYKAELVADVVCDSVDDASTSSDTAAAISASNEGSVQEDRVEDGEASRLVVEEEDRADEVKVGIKEDAVVMAAVVTLLTMLETELEMSPRSTLSRTSIPDESGRKRVHQNAKRMPRSTIR